MSKDYELSKVTIRYRENPKARNRFINFLIYFMLDQDSIEGDEEDRSEKSIDLKH